jgi:uncharacterized protein (TIGR02217 family)
VAYYVAFPGTTIELHKTPVWNTQTTKSSSGKRRATQRYGSPLWHFEMRFEFLRRKPTLNDLDLLWAMFGVTQGQTNEFFFLDLDDHTASNTFLGTGDGATTTFQLQRVVGYQNTYYYEPVRAVSGTPSIFVNGVEQFPTAISSQGVVTLASAPAAAAVVSWSGTFLYRCAFDEDQLNTQQMFDLIWGLDSLKFTSVKR